MVHNLVFERWQRLNEGKFLFLHLLYWVPAIFWSKREGATFELLDLTEMMPIKIDFVNFPKITKYAKCARRIRIFCVNLNYVDNFQSFLSLQVWARDLLYNSFLKNSVMHIEYKVPVWMRAEKSTKSELYAWSKVPC